MLTKCRFALVLERKSKSDYLGYVALNDGRTNDAIKYFEEALKTDDGG